MPIYNIEVDMWWGRTHQFTETYRFSLQSLTELDSELHKRIIEFTRRYSFDCGNLNQPLRPWLGNIKITKVDWVKYESSSDDLKTFFEQEVEWTEKLIKTEKIFVNSQYNKEPASLNVEAYRKAKAKTRRYYARRSKRNQQKAMERN